MTETRQRIVRTADRLFYARGVQAVGIDEIRSRAGVSLKRLYAEFAGKDQLVLAVLDERHAQWEAGIALAAARAADARGRLLAVYDFLGDCFADSTFRGCGFINAWGELAAVSPAVAAAVREHKRSFQRYLAELSREAGGDDELAAQLAMLAEGAQTTAAIAGSRDAALLARRAAETLIGSALAA